MSDFASKMAGARPAERTVSICLRGDLVAQLEDLERQAELATKGRKAASKEDAGPAAIVAQIEALQEQMRESTEVFRLVALPPRQYRKLRAAHPPRRDDAGELDDHDLRLGFNRDTFPHALIEASTTSPELTGEQWLELLGHSEAAAAALEAEGRDAEIVDSKLTYSQFMELANAAWRLNEGDVDIPFSRAALLMNRSSGDE